MRAIGYCRVSTENQTGDDTYGLDVQREATRKYCQDNGLELARIYEDAGFSGSLEAPDRPGLRDLLVAVQPGDSVVVYKLDRVARDLRISLNIEVAIRRSGGELISVTEPFRRSDPAQDLLLNILMSFGQFEKSLITARLTGGRRAKAQTGGYSGGRPPFGYKATQDKTLAVDEEKAATVKRVFELRALYPEAPLQKLADFLNAEGHTTAKGGKFHKNSIKRIIDRRSIYEGIYRYAGVEAEGHHQAILQVPSIP
jgi:DNA invertase Pin-like site-specific DNA recombinase